MLSVLRGTGRGPMPHRVPVGLAALLALSLSASPVNAQSDVPDDDDTIDNVAGSGTGGTSDPPPPGRPTRGQPVQRRHPPTLSVTPTLWVGFRHKVSANLLFDVYLKQKAGIRELPYVTPSTDATGGLSVAWSVDGWSLSTAVELKESFKQFYGPWNGTGFDLRSAAARQVPIAPQWTATPTLLVSHLWSNPRTRDRWKVELSAPIGFALTKQVTLLPMIPAVSLTTYTHRRVGQRDWTFNVSSGIRYQLTTRTTVMLAAGFEQRQSNVPTAEYSRWVLQPKVQFRAEF